jgi:hypothetical protein
MISQQFLVSVLQVVEKGKIGAEIKRYWGKKGLCIYPQPESSGSSETELLSALDL